MTSRTLILASAIAVVFTGCASRVTQLVTPCAGKTTPTIVNDVAAIMASEGLTLGMVNENIGVVQATGDPGGIFTDGRWQVNVRSDTVFATAKMKIQNKDIYCDDKVNQMYTWYWNVRRSLERYCGAPVTFITK